MFLLSLGKSLLIQLHPQWASGPWSMFLSPTRAKQEKRRLGVATLNDLLKRSLSAASEVTTRSYSTYGTQQQHDPLLLGSDVGQSVNG